MTNKIRDEKGQSGGKILLRLLLKLVAFSVLIALFLILIKALPGSITYDYAEDTSLTGTALSGTSQPILRLYGETLTLYSPEGDAMRQVSLDLSALGEYDRALLTSGISASFEELLRLIEELTS